MSSFIALTKVRLVMHRPRRRKNAKRQRGHAGGLASAALGAAECDGHVVFSRNDYSKYMTIVIGRFAQVLQ